MNEMYNKITENIIHQFKSFKKGEIDAKNLNSNMILQMSSICKFKANGRNSGNTKSNFESNMGDVYIPITRLEKSMQMKMKEKESFIDIDNNSDTEMEEGKNKFTQETNRKFPDQTLDLDSEYKDVNESQFNPGNIHNDQIEFNTNESFQTISVFSQCNDNQKYLDNNFDNILDTTEISTIYGKKVFKGLNETNNMNPHADESSFIMNDKSFVDFKDKLNFEEDKNSQKSRGFGTYNKSIKNPGMRGNNPTNYVKNQEPGNQNEDNTLQISENSFSNKSLIKQVMNEVNNQLDEKTVKEFLKESKIIIQYLVNAEYILSMYSIYSKIINECSKYKECENLIFVNKFKSFILDIGISDKKFYEQSIREIIYNNNYLKFSEFLLSLHKLNYLKFNKAFLKYKYLLFIAKKNDSDLMELNDIERFFELIKGKRIYDAELYEKITTKLCDKYRDLFPNHNNQFNIRKLALVLEQFFDVK